MPFQPGFRGKRALTLSQVLSATSTGSSVVHPSGIEAGDLLVIWDIGQNNVGPPTDLTPTGFTQIVTFTVNNERATLSYKIAAGNEDGNNSGGINGGIQNRKMEYVFRGSSPIASVSVQDIASQATDGDPSAQVVNASGGVSPLIVLGGYRSSGAVDPRSFTGADGEITPATNAYLGFKIYNSGPQDVTIDMEDEGSSNMLASCWISCSGA